MVVWGGGGATGEAFPDLGRFHGMKAAGGLRPPAEVAADILRLEAAGRLAGDPVQDIRKIA